MHYTLLQLVAVLLGGGILLIGHGLQGVLVPVRADIEGFGTDAIGAFGAVYFLGFLVGCWLGPRLILRVGHIRGYAAAAAVGALAILAMSLTPNLWSWLLARFLIGVALSGLYMIIESWLNDSAPQPQRGQIFAIYMIVNFVAIAIGQLLLAAGDPATMVLFTLAGMAFVLSMIPVSLTRSTQPAALAQVDIDLRGLWQVSPVAMAGAVLCGAAHGGFWMLAPVFAQQRGLSIEDVALFMSISVLGGALAQWPLGWISDRVDRRLVVLVASCVTIALGLFMALMPFERSLALMLLTAAFGAGLLPQYSLLVAHANDHTPSDAFVRTSSTLLFTFGAGSLLGPVIGGRLMGWLGPNGLLVHILAALLILSLFIVARRFMRAPVPQDEKEDFVMAARTTPTAYVFDPRTSEEEAAEAVTTPEEFAAAAEADTSDGDDDDPIGSEPENTEDKGS